jgi:hypothetical protein
LPVQLWRTDIDQIMGLRRPQVPLDRFLRGQVDTAPHLPFALLSAVNREHLTHTALAEQEDDFVVAEFVACRKRNRSDCS